MGHFIGRGGSMGYVNDDGFVYANDECKVRISNSEAEFLNGNITSLIINKLPDPATGEVVYGKEVVANDFECDVCGFVGKSKAGIVAHKRFNHKV
jgi:hypothetical protein